ncbi:MAG: C10 family peptidase, partial [Tannerellaceae bacterium]|nr:C10 family peptidase [Tannerellaceae bacterium]
MKQRLLLISWAMLFVVFSAFAKQRTVEQAKALAGTFLASPSLRATTGGQQQDGLTLVYTATGEASGASDALYYVFDRGASHGFVIVSSDDRARDVLGYSDAGSFNAGSLPDNFKYWLSVYEKELQWLSKLPESYLRKSGQDQPATKAPAFEASVAPLVKSLWDQGDPYNLMTPINPTNGVRTVTGCVATAMAQIMYYHKWPATGNGIHQYTSVTHNLTSSVDFGATTYYWGNMIDVYNNSATQAQKDAVATLMFHCGVAVDMNYDVSSGAYSSDVPHALKTYFGYDTGMEYLYRDYTTNDDFVTALKTELTNERPVYYDGQSGYSGHAFVCDGYDADSKFHFNWGWSGSSNGYFELSALNPGSLGIGGGIGGFNYDQGIVIGIQKLQSITGETSFKLVYDGITTEVTSLTSISQQFEVHPGFIRNRGASDFIGNIGLALYTEGNTLVNYRQIAGFSSTNPMKPIYSVLTKPNYTLPSSLSTGTYKLCPVYSTDDDLNTHVLMSVKPGCVPYLTIEVKSNGTVAIGEPSYAAPELSFSNITIGNDSKMYLNKYTEIKARITNTGNADYVKDLRLLFFTDDPGISGQIINQSISIGKGESKEFTFIIPPQLQQANYSFSFEYITKESIEWNSEGYYFTDQTYSRSPGISVTVLPEPAAPVISLVGDLTFLNVNNASRVNKHAPNLKVKVKNTGGLFSNGFEAFFYNPSGPEYSYENQTVVIGEGEEKEIVFNSDINLEPGNYSVDIFYNGSDGWTYLNPPGLPFTLVEPETNNNLVSLTPSAGTLTPAFSAAVQDYTVEVSNATASIDLTVTAVSQYATIIGAGTQPLNVGENIFPIIVTAENGSSKTYTVTVTKSEDTNSVSASWITIIGTGPFVYDGTQHKPGITVSDGETTLTETADYTVTYGANIDAGESSGTITITGAGEYTGSATKTFAIERRALTATAMPDATKLYDRTTTAVVTLTPTNLVTADAGSVTAAATAGFDTKDVGTSIPITITGITLDGGRAFNYIAPDPDTYTGLTAGITPAPYTYAVVASQKILQYSSLTYITAPSFGLGVVLEGNSEQVAGGLTWYTDATYLTAADNTVFNTLAPVTLYWRFTTTDANYEPTVKEGGPVDFEVIEGAPQDILFDMVSPVSKVYGDASFINQAVNSTPEGNAVAYSSSAPAVATVDAVTGEVTILSAGQTNITATAAMVPGKYRSTSATYELIVSPKPITGADVTVDGTYIYNGSPRTPAAAEITVSLSGHTLTAGTDYTIGAGTATAPGIATVTVSGAGNYTGSATGSFTIDKL